MVISRKVLWGAGLCMLALVVSLIYLYATRTTIAYIDSVRLFEEYTMKKELQQKLETKKQTGSRQLDSMKIELQKYYEWLVHKKVKDGSPEAIEYFKREQMYFSYEKDFQDQIESLSAQYTSEVWKQLNQYIQEYGAKHSYDYIMGAKGDGNLMYAHTANDLTDELLKYVNARYEGEQE
jgi:outer membrane protein